MYVRACRLLKRRQIAGPEACALATVNILLQVVAKGRWADVDQLMDNVQRVGRKLVATQPRELVIGNIVRRVLRLIRDEAVEDRTGDAENSDIQATPSIEYAASPPRLARQPTLTASSSFLASQAMLNLLSAEPLADSWSVTGSGTSTPTGRGPQVASNVHALRSEVIEAIEELKDELHQADDQIAGFAEVQIHPSDYVRFFFFFFFFSASAPGATDARVFSLISLRQVLVYQPSPTVERFLIKAAAKRRFTLFLCGESTARRSEEAPYANLRKKLASAKVKTVRITSSGVAAYMPKVNKVVLDARAITAAGGVLADSGAEMVARAAHELGKPVIVLGGVFKLSCESPDDPSTLVDWGDPAGLVDFSDGAIVSGADVENAVTDYIRPEFVDIYLSNLYVTHILSPTSLTRAGSTTGSLVAEALLANRRVSHRRGPHSRDHLQSIIADHYKREDTHFDSL